MAQGFYGGFLGNAGAFSGGGTGPIPLLPPLPAVRFNPADLNVQPVENYNKLPGYNPFEADQQRDRFILHDPRSGVAALPEPMSQESFEQAVDARRLDNRLKQMGYSSLLQYLRDTGQIPPARPGGMKFGI